MSNLDDEFLNDISIGEYIASRYFNLFQQAISEVEKIDEVMEDKPVMTTRITYGSKPVLRTDPEYKPISKQVVINLPVEPPIPTKIDRSKQPNVKSTCIALEKTRKLERQQEEKINKNKKSLKMMRCAGDNKWYDPLLEFWDKDDYRIFCGDLGNDTTDELLAQVFRKYQSFQKARVVRDKRTDKSKGYGFVSLGNAKDFVLAMREMNGRMKYITATLLARMGGNDNPTIKDIEKIFSSIDAEFEPEVAKTVLNKMNSNNIETLISQGLEKMSKISFGSSSGAAAPCAGSTEKVEEKKEEKAESDEESDADSFGAGGLFGD
ncbi:60S acidic ribosomal protein P2 [Intoshia linei]|uniref:Large ribosomal subunit protein P2 n=1 Tax=Intoshia linei TaxID=1819745 RepID=A0A177B6U9_9BILA|nr:60S acidic ribosomal protein P2 [Intoshia linei]